MRTISAVVLVAAATLLAIRPSRAELPATPALGATAAEAASLSRDLDGATAAKDWTRALPLAERASEIAEKGHVDALYRLARIHAQLGHRKDALDALQRASDAGIVDVLALRRDSAFATVRHDERFRVLLKTIETKRYIAMLEKKERDASQKPDEVMRTLGLRPGERVADIGAGSGYFTLRIARAVGPEGRVLAIDINPDLLGFLDRRAKEAGLANVKTFRVEKDDPSLPPAGIDTILMVDAFHYVTDRAAYARKLRAGLAPGGRIAVIDYKLWSELPGAPPPERRLSRESLDEAMAASGLLLAKDHEFLPEQFFVEYVLP